jgi:curli biogenesis system outer membrane secretion channel CsgG
MMKFRFQLIALIAVTLCGLFAPRAAAVEGPPATEQPAVAAPTPPPPPAHRRKRIAVVRFEVPKQTLSGWYDQGNVSPAAIDRLSGMLADMLVTALVKTGAFDVIERTELEKILEEQTLDAKGVVDPATAAKSGKVLGVDMILGGKLTEFGVKEKRAGVLGALTKVTIGIGVDTKNSTARAVIDARIVETTTARILMAETGTGENSEGKFFLAGTDFDKFVAAVNIGSTEWTESRIGRATRQAVDQIVQKVLDTFPVETAVRGVLPDGSVILDLGRFSGIKVGDQFEVMRETILFDEDTGEEIYRDHKTLGLLEVVEVQDERCKCKVVGGLAEPPKKGDYAVLKKKAVADKDKKKK